MATATHDKDRADQAELNEFVVESAHVDLVTAVLGDYIEPPEPSQDARLGLTLVTLRQPREAAERVFDLRRDRAEARKDESGPHRPAPERSRDGWTDLDKVVDDLRAVFELNYNGWAPQLGKNRYIHGVQFVTYPNAGGASGPTDDHNPDTYPNAGGLNAPTDASNGAARMREFASETSQTAGRGVLVGLPDTRLTEHPDLTGCYFTGGPRSRLMVESDKGGKAFSYVDGHCTFLASLILRKAPAARLDIRPVLERPADRAADLSVWRAANELVGYLDSGVEVINLSWACYTRDGKSPLVLSRAIALLAPRILVVAAAGNHGAQPPGGPARGEFPDRGAPAYPAALPDVTAVGALDRDLPAEFNPTDDHGRPRNGTRPLAPWIDLLAPGVDVVGAYFGYDPKSRSVDVPDPATQPPTLTPKTFSGYATWSGTSFAAANVTGAVAARMTAGGSARDALERVLDEQAWGIRRARQ
ncbi:MAG: rane-anchored mycosin [Mycobacteriales bacterium]